VIKEKTLTTAQARFKLSEIIERVANHGEAYIVTKRKEPRAVIIGVDQYLQILGTSRYFKTVRGKRIMKIGGIATLRHCTCASR
jgi:prevent-host-death family protein